MITLHGTMQTTHGERYIAQVCGHLEKMTEHGADRLVHAVDRPLIRTVERLERGARLTLTCGECLLRSTPSRLDVRIEAANAEEARTTQHMITRRLDAFGNREGAAIVWASGPNTDESSGQGA